MRKLLVTLAAVSIATCLRAETFEPFKYGDFNSWITRTISESKVLGGKTKTLYEIGPESTITGNKAYTPKGGSPWATSNVYAKVVGISKGSNAVFPDVRSGSDKCVKLTTIMEHCKAIGLINIDVLVTGSIFLGQLFEPITSTSDPYSKMEMGVPFTRRPKALQFDYKMLMPSSNTRTYSSGFGKKKTYQGHDKAEVIILLQRRWEDADGNLYAARVGTGRQFFETTTSDWINGHRIPIKYGDISNSPDAKGLINGSHSYYARNSKGKMVPVQEVKWDDANATPTHMIVMASTGSGTAYIGTIGLTLWVDNMGLVF